MLGQNMSGWLKSNERRRRKKERKDTPAFILEIVCLIVYAMPGLDFGQVIVIVIPRGGGDPTLTVCVQFL